MKCEGCGLELHASRRLNGQGEPVEGYVVLQCLNRQCPRYGKGMTLSDQEIRQGAGEAENDGV